MEKTMKYCYGFCLFISVTINILFSINLYVGGVTLRWGEKPYVGGVTLRWGEKQQVASDQTALTWSEKAAAEAEAVAAISCSGHGRAYVDGSISEGQHVCECNVCYGGIDCSELSLDCDVDADSGDPLFLEPFWMQHAVDSAVVVSGWHRMSYQYADNTIMSSELDRYIRKLHSIVGNAVTQGRYLVFGVGSSQLLSAAVYALSSNSTSNVLTTIPYYPMYRLQTQYFNSKNFSFEGDTTSWKSNINSTNNMEDVIEFVTSPNNPDGKLMTSVLGGNKTIYDHAYLWPHFTPIAGPSDHDVMLFTLSKLTGHAGARFGWAVIKDKDVHDRFLTYIQVAELSMSKDTQLRVLKLLKVAVEDDGKPLFEFAYKKMRDRWDRLTSVFAKSTRFSIQDRHPLHCNFFNQTRLPTPAYAWVKCEREDEEDCGAVLREAGKIISRGGRRFGDKDRYTRLSLIKSQDDFELLLQRLTRLISLENTTTVQTK